MKGRRTGWPRRRHERRDVRQTVCERSLSPYRSRRRVARSCSRSFGCARIRLRADLKRSLRRRCAGTRTAWCWAPDRRFANPLAVCGPHRLPIALLPSEEDIEVETVSGPLWVPPGTLVLLTANQEWRIALDRIVPIVVLSLSDSVEWPVRGMAGVRRPPAPPA